jgi:hypothetical protein
MGRSVMNSWQGLLIIVMLIPIVLLTIEYVVNVVNYVKKTREGLSDEFLSLIRKDK